MIAALYVQRGGCYWDLPGVDPWDEERDARLYNGPWPVVAHPPCARWGRYWHGGPSSKVRKILGDDGGCFASALESVHRFGGVIEHPAHSYAWRRFLLPKPPASGGWVRGVRGGWSCHVDQHHYGHRAQKATWLYVFGASTLPDLVWGKSSGGMRIDAGFHSAEERRAAKAAGWKEPPRLSDKERAATPIEFRDVLIAMAQSARCGSKRDTHA